MSNKVPQIRFNGYSDAWEERKLTDVTHSYSGLTYSPTDVQDKGTFVLRSSNVKNDQLIDADNVYVNPDIVNSNNVKVGDVIVVVRNGSRSLIGKHAIVTKEMPHTVIGAFMSAFRGENGDYINALLSTNNFQKEVHKSLGATINQITGKDFSMMNFLTPKLEEQNKIGSFFKQLDNTIALHQRKLAKLKELKQGYLQKLFPKNGSKFPQLRFAGFADAWEQREFGQMYKKVNEKNDLTFSKDQIISVANMYFKTDAATRSDDDYMKTYNIFRLGDIAFEGNRSKHFAYGRFVENTIGDGIVSHVFDVFRPFVDYDLTYWKYAIHNERVMGRILMTATTSSTMMTNLVAKDFLKRSMMVPELAEQKKIGELLSALDKLIAANQRKLDLLKEQKKGFLQKMFV